MPVAIDCQSYGSASPPKYATRIVWAPNTENARWRWDVGDTAYMRRSAAQAASHNLKIAQSKVATDVSCAIWRSQG